MKFLESNKVCFAAKLINFGLLLAEVVLDSVPTSYFGKFEAYRRLLRMEVGILCRQTRTGRGNHVTSVHIASMLQDKCVWEYLVEPV